MLDDADIEIYKGQKEKVQNTQKKKIVTPLSFLSIMTMPNRLKTSLYLMKATVMDQNQLQEEILVRCPCPTFLKLVPRYNR